MFDSGQSGLFNSFDVLSSWVAVAIVRFGYCHIECWTSACKKWGRNAFVHRFIGENRYFWKFLALWFAIIVNPFSSLFFLIYLPKNSSIWLCTLGHADKVNILVSGSLKEYQKEISRCRLWYYVVKFGLFCLQSMFFGESYCTFKQLESNNNAML